MTRIDDENPLKLPIKIDDTKVQVVYNGSYVSLFIKDKTDVDSVYNQLKVVKTNQFEVYKTTDVPAKYNFNAKDDRLGRIGEIILDCACTKLFSNHTAPKGSHGFFVKETPEMKATFMAWGPNFKSGKVIKPFENIQIYPMLAKY
ncbi:Uncharacterised protein [Algoriella xinjiangensis]|nr:hypothetical protein [Algoriella xinjiangensis]VDH16471.1 Uncharacterised protein [Algoriella xinjiangensis]